MTGDKFRFRFRKSGTLRLVSHHDLMRCCERMLRRAAVPFKSTAGFHPTPRLVFALSLPLGVIGLDEVVELELTEPRDGEALMAALNAQAPTGMVFTRVTPVPMKSTARVRRVVYELPLPPERLAAVEAAVVELLARPKVWVERLRPSAKRLNIRPYVRGVRVERQPTPPTPFPEKEGGESIERSDSLPGSAMAESPPSFSGKGVGGVGSSHLLLDLWVTQEGTARAEELLNLLGIADLLETGAVLTRTTVEIRDEITATEPGDAQLSAVPAGTSCSVTRDAQLSAVPAGTSCSVTRDAPPDGPADAVPLTGAEVAALTARLQADESEQPAGTSWGASPNGPVVE